MYGKIAITGLVAFALLATAIPVNAGSDTETQEYIGANQGAGLAFCSLTGENIASVCYDIPQGANAVTFTITDDLNGNDVVISARIIVDGGDNVDSGRECGEVGFDTIPEGATEIFVWVYGVSEAATADCPSGGGTTGTLDAAFEF